MSDYAKSIVGGIAAVLVAGITAWQSANVHGFHIPSLLPVISAVLGAALTYLAPNTPQMPTLKAWAAGAFAVLTAAQTAVTGLPADATVMTVAVAALGVLGTWAMPNVPRAVKVSGADVSPAMGPDAA